MRQCQARAQFDRPPQFAIALREIVRGKRSIGKTSCGMSFAQVFIERESFVCCLFRFAPAFNGRNVS